MFGKTRRTLYRTGSALGWVNAAARGALLTRIVRVFLYRVFGSLMGRIK